MIFNCKISCYSSLLTVLVYNELLANLKHIKYTVRGESRQKAIQTVYDDIKNFLTWLRQEDGEQARNTGIKFANDLAALESQLNLLCTQPLRERVHDVSNKIRPIIHLPIPIDPFVNELNKAMKDFNDKLKEILGCSC